MDTETLFQQMREHPVFYLATCDGDQPRVRGMLLYRADENGIVFHTASTKDVFAQIQKNPKAEMCFSCNGMQIRVTGVLEQIFDEALRAEIFAHPTRKFLQAWKENGVDDLLQIFIMRHCTAVTWTMETNFAPKEPVTLC